MNLNGLTNNAKKLVITRILVFRRLMLNGTFAGEKEISKNETKIQIQIFMDESNKETGSDIETEVSKEKRSILATLGWVLFGMFFVMILIYAGAKTIRDQKPSEVSIRFVRNNEIIKQKTGGIVRIQGYSKMILSGNSWETTGKIFGNENNIEVTVYGYCGDGMSASGSACSVSSAKYRNANDIVTDWKDGDWNEIEISKLEKMLLVFK